MGKIVCWALAALNLWGFLLCGWDKLCAARGWRRIRERTLFLLAAVGGGPGVWAAMYLFRHKTRHRSFVFGVPALTAASYLALGLAAHFWGRIV